MDQTRQEPLVDPVKLGRLLRAARIVAGYESVADAAEGVRKAVGLDFSDRTLYALERGKQQISLEQFFALLMTYPTPGGPFFYFNAYREDLQEKLAAGGRYDFTPESPGGASGSS